MPVKLILSLHCLLLPRLVIGQAPDSFGYF